MAQKLKSLTGLRRWAAAEWLWVVASNSIALSSSNVAISYTRFIIVSLCCIAMGRSNIGGGLSIEFDYNYMYIA